VASESRLRRFLRTPPGEILSALTIVGVLLYSVSWFAYRGLYAELGLAPSDVGLTYAAILTSSALGSVMLLTGAVTVIFFVGLLVSLDADEDLAGVIPEKLPPALKVLLRALLSILSLVLGVAYFSVTVSLTKWIIGLFPPIQVSLLKVVAYLAVGFIVFTLGLALLGVLVFAITSVAPSIGQHMRRILPALYISLAVLTLSVAVLGPYYFGHRIGKEISRGQTEGLANTVVVRWLLDVEVDRVDVTWLIEKGTCRNFPRTNVILLGGADGTTILYDPGSHTLCRTPTSSLQMTSRNQ
jgi:hypothetical protein